ncbi:MAG: GGDEF domain-containing protein, partial [Candidatus Sungbacteria bacterium]|nr:GGDEF domain-containing protein [Candidatus Sungbacteria bacterium]
VLKEIAAVLRHRLRDSDIFGRWGGEEFVAALLGASLEAAKKVGESLRAEIEKRDILIDGKTIKVTISLGIAGYGKEKNLDEIINKADKAMYEAKRQGKNRVTIAIDN